MNSICKFAYFTATLYVFNLDIKCSVRGSPDSLPAWSLPSINDTFILLDSVEQVIQSYDSHKNDIILETYFGLFSVYVHLRHVMLTKSAVIPKELNTTLERVVETNGRLLRFFLDKLANTQENSTIKNITLLFRDYDSWARRLNSYNPELNNGMKRLTKEELLQKFSSWSEFMERAILPIPGQTDACEASLAQNPSGNEGPPYKCFILDECYHAIQNGTSYGYGTVHRLLILLLARYSRGCFIYSPQVDDSMIATFCTSMYDELQYIAAEQFRLPDLFKHQMILCSLAGYKEFLQWPLLNEVLRLEKTIQCFDLGLAPSSEVAVTEDLTTWTPVNDGTQINMSLPCGKHVSAKTAEILGAAVRYIIETSY